MIVVTVFLSILNQMEFHSVQNQKENCHHDLIPFNEKGNGNIVFSVYGYIIVMISRDPRKVIVLAPSYAAISFLGSTSDNT